MQLKGAKAIKKICIYGVGGVGGYFGGKIAHKLSQSDSDDHEVYFVARGQHLAAIQEKGLILNTDDQRHLVCKPTLAAEDFKELPQVDLVFVCVKSYDLDSVIEQISGKVSNDTIIIPLLNGADIYERIRSKMSTGLVLPACVLVGVHIEEPGVVSQKGGSGTILFGKDPQSADVMPANVLEFFDHVGIKYQWIDDPYPAIWEKYIFIAPFALVTASSGKVLGEVMEDMILRDQVRDIMQEVALIAKLEGVALRDTIVEESLNKANDFPYETKTSFQRDYEQAGKRNEADLFGGTILRLGKKHSISTPVTERIYSHIRSNVQSADCIAYYMD